MPKLLIATTVSGTLKAFLLPYADHFRGKGWTVDAMSRDATKSPELSGRFDNLLDANWSRNPFDPKNLAECPRIRETVSRGGYDIVHVHTPVAAFVTRLALRGLRSKSGLRVVYTAHGFHFYDGGSPGRNFAFRTLERMAGRWTDRLVVINHDDFEAAKKYRIVDEASLCYMPGIGLDFSKYGVASAAPEDVANFRDELGLSDDDILLTMIAEFVPGKRHSDAIEALALTKKPELHIAFAGSGDLLTSMKKLAKDLGVAKRTHFLGFREDIPRILRASRACLLSSGREGLARSLMESACLGVPIIGAYARGIRDVVTPERGLLYPTGDVLALRDAMLQMAYDPMTDVEPDPLWRIENLTAMHDELYGKLLR
jgi:glycosyltransferase involved in cell wall biosynthesis